MALAAACAAAVACLFLALAASAAGAGSHHAPAPAPAVDCNSVALALSDCFTYVLPGSTDKSPSKACCGEVKTTVASPASVDCLCKLAGSKNLPVQIDMKRVLALPGACGASNAVFSKCHTPAPSAAGGSSSGGATAAPPHAAASSPVTAAALVAAPLLALCYLF